VKWKVHHDGKVREWDEATVLSKLDKCDLTGIELAKPPGAETWAPLHSTALYQQVVPHQGDLDAVLRRRVLTPWLRHIAIFVVLFVVFSITGLPTMWFPFWGIGVAVHGLSTLHKWMSLPDRSPTAQDGRVATAQTPSSRASSELLAAIDALIASGWHDDLTALRQAAEELAIRRAVAVDAADPDATQALIDERASVQHALTSADDTTAAMLRDQLGAIDARIAFHEEVQRLATRLQTRERTLLHQVESLRLGALSKEQSTARVDLDASVVRLRSELRADAEVSDALARARNAQRT